MNIMKTTLCQCQNKEVVSVTINVFVNGAKTHPNGCSFSSFPLLDASKKGTKKHPSETQTDSRVKLCDVIYLVKNRSKKVSLFFFFNVL